MSGLVGCSGSTTDRDVKLISVAETRRGMLGAGKDSGSASLLLVDPRPATKFDQGHIPGARNITLADVSAVRRLPELDRAEKTVVYSTDPGSPTGIGMAKRLVQLGYDEIYLLEGGLLGWKLAGGKLEAAPKPAGQ